MSEIAKDNSENRVFWKLYLSTILEQPLKSILNYVQPQSNSESSNISYRRFFSERNDWAGGSVWHERRLRKAEVAGSNPARSTEFSLPKEHSLRKFVPLFVILTLSKA